MKRLILTIFVFMSLIYITGCKDTIKDPEDAYFKGRVVDTLGNPLDSVRVSTFPPHRHTYTNSDGYFDLRVFPRMYRLDLRKGKFFITKIETTASGIDTFDIGIEVNTSTETLSVTYDTTNNGIIRTTIVRSVTDSSFYNSVSTDSVDIQSGQTYDFGDITMDTARIYIETIDTTIDTL